MSNNYQNPQIPIQMQSQHYQNMNPGMGNNIQNLNSPIIQNQKDLQQLNQLNSPHQAIPPQMAQQNYNQPPPMLQPKNTMNRPQPHSKYFFKGTIDYPSFPTFLPIEKFGDLLMSACSVFNKINFEPVYVDKPKEGSIFLILIPKNDENIIDIPSDGYGWMDDENLIKTFSVDNDKKVECYERRLGFAQGQLYCTISRRRFRLRSHNFPMIELLQYVKLHENVPVIPAQIKVQPQNIRLVAGYPPQPQQQPQPQPQPQQQQQQQMQQQQYQMQQQQQHQHQQQQQQQYKQNMNQMNKPMMQQQPQIPPQQNYSRPHTPHRKKTNSNPYRYDDEESGDELDVLQARDISIGRYRRNHDYMSEILSPYNIDSIEPPEIIDINNRENLSNELEKLTKEIEILENDMMENNKKNENFIHSSINKISKCKTEEELQRITNEVNQYLDIQLIPKSEVRKVKI
ncbi:hypothetical protein H8356DRAFT_1059640 [Neocallimastix lanati (nom. inval.)]|jgi:hypothetical protein|uniref:Uncharacterized protein n=1 Tax=Neocallimastix californiae TaxID=1754190 RepID=A0A1Y2CKL3_9FUNG|nr:hypothetical protein H8356DRAFT_1059640 [Neocallimastix sp. JGI-2020a]ORY47552.1 hypothetical protein LY90DRAFT_671184 [Neocallimastix californiae]|eukprot:ORY47552.1 hypothetical protein LY90DRAFT_671184 [Neocallimastix californiae]